MNHLYFHPVKCEHHPSNSTIHTHTLYLDVYKMLDGAEWFSQKAMCTDSHRIYTYRERLQERVERQKGEREGAKGVMDRVVVAKHSYGFEDQ